MTDNKIENLLTLAVRSGNAVSGDETCINYLKKGTIHLIIIAEDASENTTKKFKDKTSYRNVPMRFWKQKEELGSLIGKTSRTIIGITDKGFADKLLQYFDELF